MLTKRSAVVVAATAPVVAEHADAITKCFYPKLFAADPELLRVFNTAHQATGEQPKALAASVVAYAVHLLDPEARDLRPMLDRIAHRHVSLGIRPDQYPIVGRYLLEAVAEVLGEAVTAEVAAAWDEVYWLFALELITAETRLYAQADADPGSPWMRWVVTERIDETDDVMTLRLVPEDGSAPRPVKAGQYLSVAVDLPTGGRQARQYSVSSADTDALQITIKRIDPDGDAPAGCVSSHLHRHTRADSVLELGPVAGDVTLLPGDGPVALISAGIGITPILAMLESLADEATDRRIVVAHADRNPATHALRAAHAKAARRLSNATLHTWYEQDRDDDALPGRMDLGDVEIDPGSIAYICGPLPFMRGVRLQLLRAGVQSERIFYEVFGPDVWAGDEDTTVATHAVS
ncbi:globin domain-containing protein [Patulibacter sp. NPDC049589]|uniref:globin domain-containing protein n=1 Tax=Patulibacter sp. NPDC049589 TaxID=3154731 RepID=UPI00342D169A